MGSPLGQRKRCRGNIHFAVADKYIAVTSKTTEASIFVNIGVVCVEKAAVTNN